jgi:hypothetical protein
VRQENDSRAAHGTRQHLAEARLTETHGSRATSEGARDGTSGAGRALPSACLRDARHRQRPLQKR